MRKEGERLGRRFNRRRRETVILFFFFPLFTDRRARSNGFSLSRGELSNPSRRSVRPPACDLNVLRDARSARIPLHFLTIRHWRLIKSECRRVLSHSCRVAGNLSPLTRRHLVTWPVPASPTSAAPACHVERNRSPLRWVRYGRGAGLVGKQRCGGEDGGRPHRVK